MPKIIKDGTVVEDNYVVLDKDCTDISAKNIIVSLKTWNEHKASLSQRNDIGVWLDSDESAETIAEDADQLTLIALNFPVFSDGRAYSYARELRERFDYKGELRAIGDVLRDQLFLMKRCGFNSFAVRDDLDCQACLENLADFSQPYQGAYDEPRALHNRQSRG
jgi:uncharacterized protein (DUF934 family)